MNNKIRMLFYFTYNDWHLHHPPLGSLWPGQSHYTTWPFLGVPKEQTGICKVAKQTWGLSWDCRCWLWTETGHVWFYLVGTGTSVRPPRVVAWANRTKATKGLLRKSTSPTKTLDASASLGIFFMNLFFSYRKRRLDKWEHHFILSQRSEVIVCVI